mmetsp:Transcript_50742/g.136230  ORF Transcript_50742/g.136230 Transcript_50742/m.136230 type:complete len:533 (-) Transcript_50742:802-2400(-)
MRASAELDAGVHAPRGLGIIQQVVDGGAYADDADGVGVLLAEDGAEAVDGLGVLQGDLPEVDGVGLLDLPVADLLDLPHLVDLDGLVVREVETQLALVHQGALLVDLAAEHGAQREVQDVRRGVVLCDEGAAREVDGHGDLVADLHVALARNIADVQDIACILLRVVNSELNTRRGLDGCGVEGLTALLGIERGLVQDQATDLRAAGALLDEILAVVDRQDLGLMLLAVALRVPIVLRRVVGHGDLEAIDQLVALLSLQHHVLLARGGLLLLGALPELRHLLLEAGHVHRDIELRSHELGEVGWEAVGGVQQERVLAGDVALLGEGLQLAAAFVEGPAELLLLLLDDGLDVLGVRLERGEGIAERLDDRVDQGVEESRRTVEDLSTVAHGAAQHTAQDVAAALVGRNGAVRQGDGQGADVIGDHSVGHVDVVRVGSADLAGVVPGARLVLDGLEDGAEEVGVVVAGHVQEHGGDALQTHARVHALGGQRDQRAVGLALELHEDDVPDLEQIGVICVHQVRTRAVADAIVVDL